MIIFFEDFKNPIFIQQRVGKNKKPFKLFKLRTMHESAPNLGTHEVDDSYHLKCSNIIRKFKIDELPQFYNVLIGEMSIVGPRPCLTNQRELIKQREIRNVFSHKPGITGIAQLKGIMMDQAEKQSSIDSKYNDFFGNKRNIKSNIYLYFYCIINTVFRFDQKLTYLNKIID